MSVGAGLERLCRFVLLAAAIAVSYFLAARLGLALRTEHGDVAVFWPASGIAVGLLIILGTSVRPALVVGVIAGTIAANIMSDRSLLTSVLKGVCAASEPVVVVWLIGRWFGRPLTFRELHHVPGFILATAIAMAASGFGGAATMTLLHSSAPFWDVWSAWFLSAAIGTVVVAPIVIELGQARRGGWSASELIEGLGALFLLALISAFVALQSSASWITFSPGALVLPLLLWLAARCRAPFAVAGAFIACSTIIMATTYGIGRYGDASVPIDERVKGAQLAVTMLTVYTLVLTALFAERRRHAAAAKDSNNRLQLALEGAELGVWTVDVKTGQFESDSRDKRIHGYQSDSLPKTLAEARPYIHPHDLPSLDAAFAGSRRAGQNIRAEYRLAPIPGNAADHSQERWVAVEGSVVRDADGRAVRLLGVTRDITKRKQTEKRLLDSERNLRELIEALPAAVYVTDASGFITYYNAATLALWGVRPELGVTRLAGAWKAYWSDGSPMALEECPAAIALREKRPVRGIEATVERPDGTRVSIIPFPTPIFDASGKMTGMVNMLVDISERKRAEQALADRNAQLDLAGRIALVGCFLLDPRSGKMQVSPGYAAIHGLPDGTVETDREGSRARFLGEDVARVDAQIQQAVAEGRRELFLEYRIVQPDGELRWIESRSRISYDRDNIPRRVVGANIDVTERKQTEAVLKESEARLADALAAGQVIAFEWDARTGQSRRSDNARRILGDEEHSVGCSHCNEFLSRVHPDDRERFKAHIHDLCPDNASYALSFRFCGPDGRQVWLEETAKGEFDAAGRLVRIKGLTRNITERKTAELALAERTLQLALAERAALVGSLAYDVDTEVMQVSAGYVALHGFPEGTTEIPRSAWRAGVHPEDRLQLDEMRRRAFRERANEYNLDYRIVRPGGEVRWINARIFVSYRSDGRPKRVVGVDIDVTGRKRAEEHQRTLVAELDHRVKNVLATVSTVAAHTMDSSSSMSHFVAALDGRIRSMASTHELLSGRQWQGIPLADLLRRELAPYASNGNTGITGPDVLLSADAGQTIASVFHELTTNAAKYGALSLRNGRVSVHWHRLPNGHVPGRLAIEWVEAGGPPVKAPKRPGYGTAVITELVPYELGGAADLTFGREGVRCRLEIPEKWVGTGRHMVLGATAASNGTAEAEPPAAITAYRDEQGADSAVVAWTPPMRARLRPRHRP